MYKRYLLLFEHLLLFILTYRTNFTRNTIFSNKARYLEGKISIIIGMVVFDVKPTTPLHVPNLLYDEYSLKHCN